jgi:hypothetical protein
MTNPPPTPSLGQAAPAVGFPILASLALREELQAVVESCARELMTLAPRLRLRRAIYDGEWVVGVHQGGLADSDLECADFSRLDIQIRVDVEQDDVTLTRRSTIRNRDDEAAVFSAGLDESGRGRLTGFIETAFLEFARRYFDAR